MPTFEIYLLHTIYIHARSFFCKIYIMGSREGLTNYWINVHALILRLDWSTNERSLITSDGLVGVIILLAFCAISRNFCCYLWMNIKQYSLFLFCRKKFREITQQTWVSAFLKVGFSSFYAKYIKMGKFDQKKNRKVLSNLPFNYFLVDLGNRKSSFL